MTQKDAKRLVKIGSRVIVRTIAINGGVPDMGVVTRIYEPGRDYCVRTNAYGHCNLFNDEFKLAK
jgi:hypothetical protein